MNIFKASLYVLMFVLLGPGATAQQETFSSQSNLVLVPMMVRDEKGDIVYALHAQDFIDRRRRHGTSGPS